jgi:hypothetical protein
MAISPEQRELALRLLREKGHLALRDIEDLLGWNRPVGMLNRVMAGHLGITERQLKYLIHRQHEQVKEEERRRSERDAKAIMLVPKISNKLGFSISLPAGWQVTADTEQIAHLAQEYSEMMQRSQPGRVPKRRMIFPRRADLRDAKNVVDLTGRLQAQREHEERKGDAERHARLERMAVGLFQAAPPADDDEPFVEITKLRLESPLTAMDLYNLDKHLPEAVPWGNRPSKELTVDGVQGVVYYFAMNTSEPRPTYEAYAKQPAFFNVYLAENLEGWLISCQCRCGEAYMKTFQRYKPIFRRVIGSFRRLKAPHPGNADRY